MECSPRQLSVPVPKLVKHVWDLMENALPLRCDLHHFFHLPKTMRGMGPQAEQLFPGAQTKKSFMEHLLKFVMGTVNRSAGSKFRNDYLHSGTNQNGELFSKLCELGLTKEGIPKSLGGEWGWAQTITWCRMRVLQEEQPSGVVGASTATAAPERSASSTASFQLDPLFVNDNCETNKSNKRKIMNVVYSRRKREKQRQEKIELEHEAKRLKKSHEILQLEEKQLQALLDKAKAMVAALDGTSSVPPGVVVGEPPMQEFFRNSAVGSSPPKDCGAGFDASGSAPSNSDLFLEPRQFPPNFSHKDTKVNHQQTSHEQHLWPASPLPQESHGHPLTTVENDVNNATKGSSTSTWEYFFGQDQSNHGLFDSGGPPQPKRSSATWGLLFGSSQAVATEDFSPSDQMTDYAEPLSNSWDNDPLMDKPLLLQDDQVVEAAHHERVSHHKSNFRKEIPPNAAAHQPSRSMQLAEDISSHQGAQKFPQQAARQFPQQSSHHQGQCTAAATQNEPKAMDNSNIFQLANGILQSSPQEQQRLLELLNNAIMRNDNP